MSQETKFLSAGLNVKELDEQGRFSGYASVFGVQDSDGDVIVQGAFKRTLSEYERQGRKPKLLWQHMRHELIGSVTGIGEDEHGLWFEGRLIMEIQKAKEAYALMKAGELTEVSIGFMIREAAREQRGTGRVIEDVDLMEISLVTWAANPEARVTSVKARNDIREFERFLRESGFSRTEAVAIASKGFKGLDSQSESEGLESPEIAEAIKSLSQRIRGFQNA